MFDFQVTTPILNSPYEEPSRHWKIFEDQPAELIEARRKPVYFYRFPGKETSNAEREDRGIQIELLLVSIIRRQRQAWRDAGYPGASATTLDLLRYWSRDGRFTPLFYAQREAAETVVFLTEARADFLQGIDVPLDEPSDAARAEGMRAFKRLACKMATGTGKTTVMGMLAAWSILNKVNSPGDRRFSDAVLIVCPNVTIRTRLAELDPMAGDASLYRTRDLVPARLMPELKQGRVMVTNWHVFEKQSPQGSSRVVKTGVPETRQETIRIAEKSTTARGSRYLSLADYERQCMLGLIETLKEHHDRDGHLEKVDVRATRYVESDTRWLKRVIGGAFGGKQNVLVLNDEAHHAYRIRSNAPDEDEADVFGEDEEAEAYFKEATVWVEGLDRVHKHRGINVCLDFSATPYFLGRVSNMANRPFPWVVSDFSLTEAIESGLTKIPQLAVRDSSGASIPGYFNIWRWILPQLNTSERGGKKAAPKPEAILRYAHTPIAMLGGLWRETFARWQAEGEDRPPVFIIVCKNTKIAKVVYEWIADNHPPYGIPSAGLPELINRDDEINTIRVDSKVVEDTDSGIGTGTKGDEDRWMRVTLDTVGKRDWPRDTQGMPIYPEGFVELAEKLKRPSEEPPGKRIRCIVSVGMLTEGWDCNTVTHIVGLRPFMSQLLCEQVVGRALRRANYVVEENGLLSEEIAQVFGVPFEVVPFKDNPQRERPQPMKTWRIRALPERAHLEIKFPRVEGYVQQAVERLTFHVAKCAELIIDPTQIPQEVQMKAGLASNTGRPSLYGPGKLLDANLGAYRAGRRLQSLEFDMARELARAVLEATAGQLASSEVFGPCLTAVKKFVATKVRLLGASDKKDAFLSPHYGLMLERLVEVQSVGDTAGAELPKLETHRPPGTTADVDFSSRREPVPVLKSHVNAVVADTAKWEQQAAYFIDTHPRVVAFVKNAGLGLGVPYTHDGQRHDYVPDFVLLRDDGLKLILETKGFDRLAETKQQAARRWVAAVNAHGGYGQWAYRMVRDPNAVSDAVTTATRD